MKITRPLLIPPKLCERSKKSTRRLLTIAILGCFGLIVMFAFVMRSYMNRNYRESLFYQFTKLQPYDSERSIMAVIPAFMVQSGLSSCSTMDIPARGINWCSDGIRSGVVAKATFNKADPLISMYDEKGVLYFDEKGRLIGASYSRWDTVWTPSWRVTKN